MPSLIIEIPKKVLERRSSRRLIVVDPVEFEHQLRRRWEMEDARVASNQARREEKLGKAHAIKSLRELM